MLVNLDSQAPNRVFYQWALDGGFLPALRELTPEQRYGDSRFDFAYRAGASQGFVEVKGVTLEEDGVAYFPDAPTLRGVRHVEELCRAAAAGDEAWLCFVIPVPGVGGLRPNDRTHPAFGDALRRPSPWGFTCWPWAVRWKWTAFPSPTVCPSGSKLLQGGIR